MQATIGDLIKDLGRSKRDVPVSALNGILGVDGACSYRGYYNHLALNPATQSRYLSSQALLQRLRTAVNGEVFVGYKGGDYLMTKDTPVWVADYGCLGVPVIGILHRDDRAILILGSSE